MKPDHSSQIRGYQINIYREKKGGGCFQFVVALWILAPLALLTAIIHDAMNDRVAWVIVDLLLFPLGVLRGFWLWLTWLLGVVM